MVKQINQTFNYTSFMHARAIEKGDEPEIWNQLERLEREFRGEIGAFALTKLSQAVRWLERTDDLRKRYAALRTEAHDRLKEGKTILTASPIADQRSAFPVTKHEELRLENSPSRGGKARGRECRAAWLAQKAKDGKPLTRVRGALYRDGNGLVVGIPYAMVRKNEWFLGLPAGQFSEAVLLCESDNDKVQAIHLTQSFIEKYEKRLSVSSQYNQTKFVVQRRAGRYYLVVSGVGDVDLTNYLTGEPMVCPRIAFE
jgi:hypothetical protein